MENHYCAICCDNFEHEPFKIIEDDPDVYKEDIGNVAVLVIKEFCSEECYKEFTAI